MSLIRQNMVKVASGANPLVLTMESGYSAIVKKIRAYSPTGAVSNHLVTVDNKSVFQFVGPQSWHYLFDAPSSGYRSILGKLYEHGLVDPIPVAEGQTLGITAPGATEHIQVIYDLHTAGDFTGTEKNGKTGKSYNLFQVISNADVYGASAAVSLNQSDLSQQFPRFPGGAVAPAGMKFTLKALFGAGFTIGLGASNAYYTTFLRLLKDREDITDLSLVGMLYLSDASYVGGAGVYSTVAGEINVELGQQNVSIYKYDPFIVFDAGAKLDAIVNIVLSGGGCAAGTIKLGMLFDVEELG